MPPTPRGRTCDRPNSRSSTTADRASDDCATYRAASRRTLRQRIRQGNYRDQRQEKQQRENPMHRVLLKTFDFSRLRAELLTGQKRDSTKCVAVSLSPHLAKRLTILFARLLNATMMLLQSTLLSVRWPTMDVSV
jgi:hypothetical protein